MKKAAEYRQHARECWALARNAPTEEQRGQLTAMAETWDALATERERMLREQQSVEAAFEAFSPVVPVPLTTRITCLEDAARFQN